MLWRRPAPGSDARVAVIEVTHLPAFGLNEDPQT